jgi:hypothetical protein
MDRAKLTLGALVLALIGTLLFIAPKRNTSSRQLLHRLSFDGIGGADGGVVQSLQTATTLNFPASNPAAAMAAETARVAPIFAASPTVPMSKKAAAPAHLLAQLASDQGASVTWPPVSFSLGNLAPETQAPSEPPPPAPSPLMSAGKLATTSVATTAASPATTVNATTALPRSSAGFDSALQLHILQELGESGPRLFRQGNPAGCQPVHRPCLLPVYGQHCRIRRSS